MSHVYCLRHVTSVVAYLLSKLIDTTFEDYPTLAENMHKSEDNWRKKISSFGRKFLPLQDSPCVHTDGALY